MNYASMENIMTTREIAAKLVCALADTHPDIRKHYDLQALENQFDNVLHNASHQMCGKTIPMAI
jgi:hypothetical protein